MNILKDYKIQINPHKSTYILQKQTNSKDHNLILRQELGSNKILRLKN